MIDVDGRGARALVRGFFAAAGATRVPQRPPVVVPPHLDDVEFRFVCECHAPAFIEQGSATIRDGAIRAPRLECRGIPKVLPTDPEPIGCGRWIDGRPVSGL